MRTQQFLSALLFTTAALSFRSYKLYAQDETDALRFSHLQPQGTARSLGFGSALGSVGGDFTSLSVNPAGIGVYRRSEFTITPSFRINGAEGTYLGSTTDDDAFRFNISNLGIVSTRAPKGERYDKASWKSVSFGIGLTRVADFNRRYLYTGVNDSSSASEIFSIDADASGMTPEFLEEGSLGALGYDSYLINFDTSAGNAGYYSVVNWRQGVRQTRAVNERGGINEAVISVGGNYEERLLLGATVGVPILRYHREVMLTERDENNAVAGFDNFTITENLRTNGMGLNGKLGAIYKFTETFRLGAALHTPTVFWLTDEFERSVASNTEGVGPTSEWVAPLNTFHYKLFTPWRAVASATMILGNAGFLTADYEYVDYASARYRFNTNNNQSISGDPSAFVEQEQAANDRIRSAYQGASNIRIGGEARLDDFFVRAGVGYYGNPYKNSDGYDPARLDLSAGIGFRSERSFIDLAFVHSRFENTEQPYALNYPAPLVVTVPTATIANRLNNVALTFGFKL